MEGVLFWGEEVFPQCTCAIFLTLVCHAQLLPQVETKVSKWDMPEELLLLLEKVEKEGAGATIPYVCPKPLLAFQHPSPFCAFSGNLANHWPSQRAQVQLVNLKALYK